MSELFCPPMRQPYPPDGYTPDNHVNYLIGELHRNVEDMTLRLYFGLFSGWKAGSRMASHEPEVPLNEYETALAAQEAYGKNENQAYRDGLYGSGYERGHADRELFESSFGAGRVHTTARLRGEA